MEYTFIGPDGAAYSLPPKTLAVSAKVDRIFAMEKKSTAESYRAQHAFVREVLGEDTARAILGTEDLAEMDLTMLTVTVNRMLRAWQKPVEDDQLQGVQQSAALLDKLAAAGRGMETMLTKK